MQSAQVPLIAVVLNAVGTSAEIPDQVQDPTATTSHSEDVPSWFRCTCPPRLTRRYRTPSPSACRAHPHRPEHQNRGLMSHHAGSASPFRAARITHTGRVIRPRPPHPPRQAPSSTAPSISRCLLSSFCPALLGTFVPRDPRRRHPIPTPIPAHADFWQFPLTQHSRTPDLSFEISASSRA
jgi:hypothetical protein